MTDLLKPLGDDPDRATVTTRTLMGALTIVFAHVIALRKALIGAGVRDEEIEALVQASYPQAEEAVRLSMASWNPEGFQTRLDQTLGRVRGNEEEP